MIKFEYQYDTNTTKVIFELPPDSSLSDVIEQFELFLKGSGYSFDGRLDLMEDANESGS